MSLRPASTRAPAAICGSIWSKSATSDGVTVVLTTHLLDEAQRADRIAIMHNGELAALDTPAALASRRRRRCDHDSHQRSRRRWPPKSQQRFNIPAMVVDSSVRLEQPNGHQWIPKLVEAFPDRIESITLGKPTLRTSSSISPATDSGSKPIPIAEPKGAEEKKKVQPLIRVRQRSSALSNKALSYVDQLESAMPQPSPPWPVVGTLSQRELVRFFRQKNRVFGALGQPIIFWLLFGAGLGTARVGGTDAGRLDYAHFFPGTLVMILLFTAIFATISIIEDRREGFLQGVLVAPVPRWSMVLGKVLGGAAIAMLQGIVFLLLGWLTGKLGWFGIRSSRRRRSAVIAALAADVRHLDRAHRARLPDRLADGFDARFPRHHERVPAAHVATLRRIFSHGRRRLAGLDRSPQSAHLRGGRPAALPAK